MARVYRDITAVTEDRPLQVTFQDILHLCEHIRSSRLQNDNDSSINVTNDESQSCSVFALEVSLLNCYGLSKLHKV